MVKLKYLNRVAAVLMVVVTVGAVVVPQPECTGRFDGAGGSWIMSAWTEPFRLGTDDPVYYAWEGDGRLTFARPD